MSVSDIFPINSKYPIERKLGDNVIVTKIGRNQERRKLKSGIQLRTWDLGSDVLSVEESEALDAFYLARNGRFDVFSFLPPINNDRIIKRLTVGEGDGLKSIFDLNNIDYYRRVYLGNGARNTAYVDGSQVSAVFYNNDDSRTSHVVCDIPPAPGRVVTVDIDRYIICRFDDELNTTQISFKYITSRYVLKEIARNSI